ILIAAVAGLALGRPWGRGPLDWWLAGGALALFAVYAAPIVLSGEATFAGYIKLDDTSTWLTITDQVMENGLDTSGLAPSTYEATLDFNLGDGYPYGVFLPLGIGHELLSIDSAWLIQPYMALLGASLFLALWALAGEAVERSWQRAAIAFVAAQPAILFGIYLWGGVKEMAAAAFLATTVALLAPLLGERTSPRVMLAPAVTMAGLVGILSPGGLVWLVPALLFAAALVWQRAGARTVGLAVGLVAGVVVLSLPILASGRLLPAVSDPLTDASALGNLFAPLDVFQIVGIWPVGDFRVSPDDSVITVALIAIAIGAAGWGLIEAARRRAYLPIVYVVGILIGSLALFVAGSPWNGAKALAAGSPAVLLAAGIGVAALLRSGRRAEAAVIGTAIVVGVLWSNVLAYREVWLAPREQLVELEEIGEEFAGEGPTLMTEYQPYGVRHFLRAEDPEGASELRRRDVPLKGGELLEKGEYTDTDNLALDGLLVYRTLVLRRSPSQSRPPFPYVLKKRDDHYEVWQRGEIGAPAYGLTEHLGFGSGLDPGGTPTCQTIEGLAERATQGALLVAALAPPMQFVSLGEQARPGDWPADPADPRLVTPEGSGTLTAELAEERGGAYSFWLGGSVAGEMDLTVNGKRVATARRQLNNDGQYVSLGEADLRPGANALELSYET
ncbi:MAG TPA: hypothetical protein VFS48_07690, partial [Solirubrobacterales bacterium]|nr:hypothetical protein [Solirubrobacterales bacterium]